MTRRRSQIAIKLYEQYEQNYKNQAKKYIYLIGTRQRK